MIMFSSPAKKAVELFAATAFQEKKK